MEQSLAGRDTRQEELVRQAKEFQSEAWDELYELYYSKMYTYLFIHVGNRTAAEDLASEVFEQAWKGIHRFQYRGIPLSSWLYRIAHNLMVDFLKRQRRLAAQSIDAGAPQISSPDALEAVADRDRLSRAMQRLTREQQQVLVLRHIEGHNVASTAQVMGKKENAIRALEFRALASLRRIMAREGQAGR